MEPEHVFTEKACLHLSLDGKKQRSPKSTKQASSLQCSPAYAVVLSLFKNSTRQPCLTLNHECYCPHSQQNHLENVYLKTKTKLFSSML